MKTSSLYVSEMTNNGDCHFEINIQKQNDKNQFISQTHAYPYTFNTCHLFLLCKTSICRVILWKLYFNQALLENKSISNMRE